jgi:hypothetical protein
VSTLHPFDGPRGLKGYTRFVAAYDEVVEVQQSSAVAMVDGAGAIAEIVTTGSPGYCWVRIERGSGPHGVPMSASAHMSRDHARELRDALDAFLADGKNETHDNKPDHE